MFSKKQQQQQFWELFQKRFATGICDLEGTPEKPMHTLYVWSGYINRCLPFQRSNCVPHHLRLRHADGQVIDQNGSLHIPCWLWSLPLLWSSGNYMRSFQYRKCEVKLDQILVLHCIFWHIFTLQD